MRCKRGTNRQTVSDATVVGRGALPETIRKSGLMIDDELQEIRVRAMRRHRLTEAGNLFARRDRRRLLKHIDEQELRWKLRLAEAIRIADEALTLLEDDAEDVAMFCHESEIALGELRTWLAAEQ